MAAASPVPINKTPAASENPMGVPPVSGNTVVLASGLLLALAVADGVALDVGVALAVEEALALGEAVASIAKASGGYRADKAQ